MKEVITNFVEVNRFLTFIHPLETTSVLQLLNVSANRSVKPKVKSQIKSWLVNKLKQYTTKENDILYTFNGPDRE